MNEISGGAPSGDAPQRIEAGPGGYDNGRDGYAGGEGDRDLKPWQRGPTGAAAPWQQRGGDDRRDDYNRDGGAAPPWAAGRGGGDNYGGYGQGGGYGGPPGGGAAPWQRQENAPPPPPSGDQYGYGGYPGGYGGASGGYGGQPAMGAPPGLGGGAGGLGAPPGLGALFQTYGANGAAGGAPPPPPSDDLPPPVNCPRSGVQKKRTNPSTASKRPASPTSSTWELGQRQSCHTIMSVLIKAMTHRWHLARKCVSTKVRLAC